MVSFKHEGIAKLVRDRPAFAAELLGNLLAVEVPPFGNARLVDVTLNQVMPAEYRADAVVLFSRRKPVFGAIVEVQLRPKKHKRFTWPLYAVGARARERCPFVVLVVTPSAATAKWAARPIDLGGGNQYRPLVIGPDGVPKLTDHARARREPQLAVLSVMAHGRRKVSTAVAIGVAATKAVLRLPEDQRLLYSLLIEASLSKAARKAIEMQPGLHNYFSAAQRRNYERGRAEGEALGEAKGKALGEAKGKALGKALGEAKGKALGEAKGKALGEAKGKALGEAKGKALGEAKGKAEAVLKILSLRGLTLMAAQRRRIVACTDLATLDRWLDRSLSASTVEELLTSPSRASRNGHQRRRPAVGAHGRKSR